MSYELTREVVIRALHSLCNPALSEGENTRLYGMCVREHGHDYKVRISLRGEAEEATGLLFARDRLDRILKAAVIDPFDGGDLNELFPSTAGEALVRAL